MVSSYGVTDFRQRLVELSAPEPVGTSNVKFLENPSKKKPFAGWVTDSFFSLQGNSHLSMFRSYNIEGTYHGDEDHTDIVFKVSRDLAAYIILRVSSVGLYVLAQVYTYSNFDLGDFFKIQIPMAVILLPILFDISHKNQLIDTFFKEMKITDTGK